MATLAWDSNLTNLRDIMADLYWDRSESRRIVQQAGLNPAFISFKDAAINNWHYILDYARHDARSVDSIIDAAIGEQPAAKQDVLLMAKQHKLNLRGRDITRDVDWKRPLDSDQLEKITGRQSTLMPIAFLQMGIERAKAVARVDLGADGSGSGCLIGNDLLLTNNHVLKDKGQARLAKVQFNYERTLRGMLAPCDEYDLSPDDLFKTSVDDDWTVVKIKLKENESPGSKWSVLKITEQDPKIDDFSIIIQHASGGPKQIALYHNVIAFVDAAKHVVQYLTDTEPGSSGSPVFDTQWNLIALHHSGGWLREPGAASMQKFYRNEGIHINRIMTGLQNAGVL